MDGKEVLRQVGKAYEALSSLEVEIVLITEDGDEDQVHRTQRRARAFFAAPDKVRIEQSGRHGHLNVTNGGDIQHYSPLQKSFHKTPIEGADIRLGSFRPDLPSFGTETFLFTRIADTIEAAEILREESIPGDQGDVLCHVVSVKYEANPRTAMILSSSPATFWVDRVTHLVRKVAGEITTRFPASEEKLTHKHTTLFRRMIVNQPIPPETFEFTPPPDVATNVSGAACGTGSIGGHITSGSAGLSGDRKTWIESSESSDWSGDAYVQRGKLRLQGVELVFERRISFSESAKEIHITERITGPSGRAEHEFRLPLA